MNDFNRDWIEPIPGVYIHKSDDIAATIARLFPPETFPDHPARKYDREIAERNAAVK